MIDKRKVEVYILSSFFAIAVLMGSEQKRPYSEGSSESFEGGTYIPRGTIGQFDYPTNPLNDRAKGYLLKGKVKNAITNYGNFITWDEHPAGLWGEYSYLPNVTMIAGVPGQKYSADFNWYKVSEPDVGGLSSDYSSPPSDWDDREDLLLPSDWQYNDELVVFCSEDAFDSWCPDSTLPCGSCVCLNENCSYSEQMTCNSLSSVDCLGDLGVASSCDWVDDGSGGEFADVVFEAKNDRGRLGTQVFSDSNSSPDHFAINSSEQWAKVRSQSPSVICISVDYDQFEIKDPNKTNSFIGLVYPWAKRPSLIERLDTFDYYDYGPDNKVWTDDDNYMYYGANVAESWFSRLNPSTSTDWQATLKSREFTHNVEVSSGDIFGDTPFSDPGDTYPLLAHSSYSSTWPEGLNDNGQIRSYWPGIYAQNFDCDADSRCDNCSKKNPYCWVEDKGRFISDNDVYMEFDDRWAHRGNTVSSGEYEQTGYPMGIKVEATAHSYGVSFAEDIMFVTVKVRNESGNFVDENGNSVSGMVMPDGTKLNNGNGFNYRDMSFGFYMDADVLSTDLNGNFGVHTNEDDFMEYYFDVIEIPSSDGDGGTERMLISMALIGDYDGKSSAVSGYSMDTSDQDPGNDFGVVAVQMLDSPLATESIDLDQDGIIDIYPGEKLKMTDWHWFDWYNRPGVVSREGSGNCCAGDSGKPQAPNKEEIQYKIMVGDTTNLSSDEKDWFFHANPDFDQEDPEFNPHFDNVEDLKQTSFFNQDPNDLGLDCVLEMTSGPFSLDVGEETLFSFCIIFGQNKEDLIANAEFAQIMYNNRYQGYTPPKRPKLTADYESGKIRLHWNDDSEYDQDIVTGYSDFEGYKIYKSTDGGVTWGPPEGKVYDDGGVQVGWRPIAQYDLTKEQDENYCVAFNYIDADINGVWDYVDDGRVGDVWKTVGCDEYFCNECNQDNTIQCPLYLGCKDTDGDGKTIECDGGSCVFPDPGDLRGLDVSGADIHRPWFSLGSNSGFSDILPLSPYSDENGPYKYTFVDDDVFDGTVYTYSVTAYDMGVAPSYGVEWNAFESGFAPDTVSINANPLSFSSPEGYSHIENSKGTTILDDNFIKVSSGYRGEYTVDDVMVYPNPYIVSSFGHENEYTKLLRFSRIPFNENTQRGADITIYTINGEKVFSWNAADRIDSNPAPGEDGYNTWWDLRTINNQEVAPGLYLFKVEFDGQTHVGKFVIIR